MASSAEPVPFWLIVNVFSSNPIVTLTSALRSSPVFSRTVTFTSLPFVAFPLVGSIDTHSGIVPLTFQALVATTSNVWLEDAFSNVSTEGLISTDGAPDGSSLFLLQPAVKSTEANANEARKMFLIFIMNT